MCVCVCVCVCVCWHVVVTTTCSPSRIFRMVLCCSFSFPWIVYSIPQNDKNDFTDTCTVCLSKCPVFECVQVCVCASVRCMC